MEDRFNYYPDPRGNRVYRDTYMDYAEQGHRTAHQTAQVAANISVRSVMYRSDVEASDLAMTETEQALPDDLEVEVAID